MKATLFTLLALCIGTVSASAAFKKGPYLQRLSASAVTVSWETNSSTAGHVEVSGGPEVKLFDSNAKGALHRVDLDGLEPGTQYSYSIFVDGKESGESGSFTTAHTAGKAYRFIVYGDNRTQHAQHKKVVAAMMGEQDIAFVLNTGDMVSSGQNESHWQTLFDIETQMLRNWPFFGAVGNHEESSGHADNYVKYLAVPKGGSDTYYAFTYGNTRFIVVDGHVEIDNPIVCMISQQIAEDCFNQKQMSWLKEELAKAGDNDAIKHVFVATHIGPYSSKPGRTGSGQMRALLGDMKANKVKVLMSGHDHYFEHGISGNGLHYIITGGGGAPLYETKPELSLLFPHEVLVSDSIHNYLVVTVAGDWVEVIAKDLDGKIIDTFEIGSEPKCISIEDCQNEKPGSCPGSWTCTDGYQCLWTCDSAPSCTTADNCKEPQPSNTCKGGWTCVNNGCQWDCEQIGECSTDADCQGKKPLIDCDNSYYKCDAQVCEFFCPKGGSGSGATGGATDESDDSDGTTDGTVKESPASSSSGCHHGPFHGSSNALWLMMLLTGALVLRRRWL